MEQIFELDQLTYRYPQSAEAAIDGVSLSLGPGIHSVRGASGSGKSTLLRLANGLVPHFHGGEISGTVKICGRNVLRSSVAQMSQLVGFVFQDPEQQSVRTTVNRDCAVALENAGEPPQRMRLMVCEALETAGIAHLADRRVDSLSGGERQRLALAGAVVRRPQLLVLDEPFSQLDDAGSLKLREALTDLSRSGVSILLSHHGEISLRFASAIALKAGHLTGCSDTIRPDETQNRTDISRNEIALSMHRVELLAGQRILAEVSLDVRAGEVVGITGTNGSGKTTLLRTLAGFAKPAAGSVTIKPGRVAYLPQNPAAMLHRTSVLHEVRYTLERSHSDEPPELVLRELQITGLRDRYPRDLSGGQRQRTAIAAVAAGSPDLLLLDEPTRGMDDEALRNTVQLIRRLSATGTAIVIATHDRALLNAAAHRIVRIEDGSVTNESGVNAFTAAS